MRSAKSINVSDYKPGVRRLHEDRLNGLLDSVRTEEAVNIVQRSLPEPSKKRPLKRSAQQSTSTRAVRSIVNDLGLLDEPNYQNRAMSFLGYCRIMNYAFNTVARYFRLARSNGVFGPDEAVNIRPDPSAFTGRTHTRIVSEEHFLRLFKYSLSNWSEYTAPVLVAMFTGLRTMEILQFTGFTLFQLKNRQPSVNVRRKRTVVDNEKIYWRPVYTTHFIAFVDKLIALYESEYSAYAEKALSVSLFYVTPKTLVNRIRLAYFKANGLRPPLGFGIHSCRNMLASALAGNTKNLPAVQYFLQHKSTVSTTRYLKTDFQHISNQFNRLTKQEFVNVRSNLDFEIDPDNRR